MIAFIHAHEFAVALALALTAGPFARYMYGGHVKGMGKPWAWMLMFALGIAVSGAPDVLPAALVSAAIIFVFNPGHGSYMRPGQRNHPDNEPLRSVTRAIGRIFRWSDLTVTDFVVDGKPMKGLRSDAAYDYLGLSVNYGLTMFAVAFGVMAPVNVFLDGSYNCFVFASMGWVAGPLYAVVGRFVREPMARWTAGELAFGGLVYTALVLA